MNTTEAHSSSVTDIFIDTMDAENRFELAIRNEGRMQQNTAVIELLVLGEEKSQ